MPKKVKIAINGFGRIGRAVLRIALTHPEIEVVAVNDPGETATLAHLLKYDTVYGKFTLPVEVEGDNLVVDGVKIPTSHDRNPENLPWQELGVEVVLECTGAFKTYDEVAGHIRAGAKKVIISAPAKDEKIKTFLFSHFPFLEEIISEALSPEEILLENELRREVKKKLSVLSEGYSKILRLKYYQGLSVREIAQKLGTTVKAIESKLSRAREAFRLEWLREKDNYG